ncbi:MAG TPA: hypothetical protein VLE48_04400 [Terriglobales bacterium]|nr:hypothetical protein [Terriglobales bacterium]
MSLLNAPEYDPRRERRRALVALGGVVLVGVLAAVAYSYRNWPEERVVSRFMSALQQRDYETAYGIWLADPEWKQHQERHTSYPYEDFYRDWGPGGEWGLIRSFRIEGADSPPGGGSGVVVEVTVNERVGAKARIWVEKKDKSLTFSPF